MKSIENYINNCAAIFNTPTLRSKLIDDKTYRLTLDFSIPSENSGVI